MPKKKQKQVYHHILYKSELHPRAQGEIGVYIGVGDHTVITDVQHRLAKDNEAVGWALVFEGLTRIMRGRLKEVNKRNEPKRRAPESE